MTVTDSAPARTRTRTMRVPRSRGAVSGLLLILLGAWGALIPFIGPYLDYSYGTDQSWHWTAARGWLEVLPGVVTAFGGLLVLISANRIRGSLGGWLAAIAGAWFVVGQTLAPLLHLGNIGQPLSQTNRGRAAAQLGYFDGLGVVILFLAAFALGRLAVVGLRDCGPPNGMSGWPPSRPGPSRSLPAGKPWSGTRPLGPRTTGRSKLTMSRLRNVEARNVEARTSRRRRTPDRQHNRRQHHGPWQYRGGDRQRAARHPVRAGPPLRRAGQPAGRADYPLQLRRHRLGLRLVVGHRGSAAGPSGTG